MLPGALGRDRLFDEDEVLDAALLLFWEKGYPSTGLTELEEVMGMGRASIYNAWGSKSALFLAAFERYVETWLKPVLERARQQGKSPLDCVQRALASRVKGAFESEPGGCLLARTAVDLAVLEDEIAERVSEELAATTDFYRGLLEQARTQGEIPRRKDLAELAAGLCSVHFGSLLLAGTPARKGPVLRFVRGFVEDLAS